MMFVLSRYAIMNESGSSRGKVWESRLKARDSYRLQTSELYKFSKFPKLID